MRIMMNPPDWQGQPDFTIENETVIAREGMTKGQVYTGFSLKAKSYDFKDIYDMVVAGISISEKVMGVNSNSLVEFYWHVQGWPIMVKAQLADNSIYLFDMDQSGAPQKSDSSPRNLGIKYSRYEWEPKTLYKVVFNEDQTETVEHKDTPDNTQNTAVKFDEVKNWGFWIETRTGDIIHFRR